MPLKQSIKDQLSAEVGLAFEKIGEHVQHRTIPVCSGRLLSRMFPEKSAARVKKLLAFCGRGHVRIGEGISAEEMDRRNMQILSRW